MACTPEDLKKFSELARDEIGETDANLAENVAKVKEILGEKYPDLRLPPDDDSIIERCLRCRKFDLDRAATQVHSYFKLLKDLHSMHKDMYFLPSIHQEIFYESTGLTVLKQRDAKGRMIIMTNWERLPSESFNADKLITAVILLMNALTISSVDTQRIGIVMVHNLRGYSFAHVRQFTLSRLIAVAKMFTGSFPMRYKAFHLVNSPLIFRYTYSLLKPFLGKKITSRVYFHGDNAFEELHKNVTPEILPDVVGGKSAFEECADFALTRGLVDKDEYYRELFKYGYMNNSGES